MTEMPGYSKDEQLGRKPKSAPKSKSKPQPPQEPVTDAATLKAATPPATSNVFDVPLDSIDAGENPRIVVDAAEQKALNASVKEHGVIQPIVLRATGDGRFQLIAGSRRLAAARANKLKAIPSLIRVADDDGAFILSLVENVQRSDLNHLDVARSLKRLIDTTGLTQETIGKSLGKTQSWVSNHLRLLGLPESVQDAVTKGKLSGSHAQSLAALDAEVAEALAEDAIKQGLSQKELDEKIRRERDDKARAEKEERLRVEQGTKLVALADQLINTPKNKRAGINKDTLLILVSRYGPVDHLLAALDGAGYNARRQEAGDTDGPAWQCECIKTVVTYDPYSGFARACIDPDHRREHEAAEKAKADAKADAGKKQLVVARQALATAMVDEGGLSLLGQKMLLYRLIPTRQAFLEKSSETYKFVKKYDGLTQAQIEAKGNANYSSELAITSDQVWDCIEGMTLADVSAEVIARLLRFTLPDDLFGSTSYGGDWDDDLRLRDYLVRERVLKPEALYGSHAIDYRYVERKVAAGDTLSKAEQKEYDRIQAARAETARKMAEERAEAAAEMEAMRDGPTEPGEGGEVTVVEGKDGPEEADVTE